MLHHKKRRKYKASIRRTIPNQATKATPNKGDKSKTWKGNIWPFIVSIAIFIASYYGGNVLNGISPVGAFILFILCLCIIFGYWTWVFTNWAKEWRPFGTRTRRVIIVGIIVFTIILTSPYYIDSFIKNQGTIGMPTFINDSTQIFVHYGTRANDYFYTKTTIGELKQEGGQIPLKINGQNVFEVHIEQNKLFIDTSLFAGIENQNQHIYSSPVVIKNNAYSREPDGWKIYQNSMNLEIDNQDGIPVLLMEYKSPYSITISGLFVTPMGICKVDNSEGNIFLLGDTLPELGTYKVDRVFIHSVFDLFGSERTYIFR